MNAFPFPSTAAHSVPSELHETPVSGVVPSIETTVQADAPPVGLVDVSTLPALSTAAHRVVLHDSPVMVCEPSGPATVVQAPEGSLVVRRLPVWLKATHTSAVVHEIATIGSAWVPSVAVVQVSGDEEPGSPVPPPSPVSVHAIELCGPFSVLTPAPPISDSWPENVGIAPIVTVLFPSPVRMSSSVLGAEMSRVTGLPPLTAGLVSMMSIPVPPPPCRVIVLLPEGACHVNVSTEPCCVVVKPV